MAAAENKRSGAIETVKQRQPSVPFAGGKKRHDQKAKGKDRQRTDRLGSVRKPRKHFRPFGRRLCANQFPARQRTKSDRKHLDPGAVRQKDDYRSNKRESDPDAIRAELCSHRPDCLSYYGNGNHFQAMKPAGSLFTANPVNAVGSKQHDNRRRERKRDPSGNGTRNATARHTDRVANLTTGRAWQEIAKRHEIGKGLLSQPLAALHKFLPKIAKVRDRTAERGQAEPEED